MASSSLNLKAPPCTPLPDPSTKPNCGYQDPGTYSPSVSVMTVFGIIGIVFSVAGMIGAVFNSLGFLAAGATYQNCFFVAATAALITWLAISAFYYKNCLASPSHTFRVCSAGVIEATFPAFSSVADQIFAFAATHDRIDVVLKSIYWAGIFKKVSYIHGSPNDDPPSSPMLSEYYHNDVVCNAGLGGSIGALAGGVAGAFLGALGGLGYSCAIFGPFAWLCALIALIIAIIIAVVSTVLGAVVGSQIGRAAGAGRPLPIGPSGPDFPSSLSVGDYVTTYGNLTGNSDDGTYIYWFVDSTSLHGKSLNKPPFSYSDPDANLVSDACCIPSMPPQGQGPIF
jgi:hypothetical protein